MTRKIGVFSLIMVWATGAWAQDSEEVQRIVAVVNDEIISEYDIDERMALITATTGNVRTQEEYDQLRKTVLQLLVDEKLQIQEAREQEISVTAKDVEQRFAELASRNRISPQQFDQELIRMGASKQSILKQLQAGIAWEEVINARLRPFLAIGEGEVNSYLDRLISNKGLPEYRVGEIFLAVDSAEQENEVRQTAERLVRQIREGTEFDAVARQFSDTATGAVGGDKGWIIGDQLDEDLRDTILGMREGQVSDPIRVTGGYYIVTMTDKRRTLSADPDETQLDLTQIVVRTSGDNSDALEQRVNEEAAGITRCSDVGPVASALGAWDQGSLGRVRLGDLPPELKQAVENLEVGQASKAVRRNDDLRVLVVCGRDEPEINEPSYAEIEDFLSNQRLAMMARRYLRDLRRDAIIDYRTELE